MTSPTAVSAPPLTIGDRGPVSRGVIAHLTGSDEVSDHTAQAAAAVEASVDIARDDDIQLALFVLYASAYGSLPQLDPDLEWDPTLLATRRILETAFERDLRANVPIPELPEPTADAVGRALFALAMRAAGLDDTYGAYVDELPAVTLASLNMMSMFGLNRRLVGSIVGHLAAYEMTSSIPCRLYADGLRRLGFSTEVTAYFDEHVEADAVHEQIAARDLAGSLAEDRPELLPDIMFGAAACLTVDGWGGTHNLESWSAGASSLRARMPS